MTKIKKGYNLKIIVLILAVLFFAPEVTHPSDILRPYVNTDKTEDRFDFVIDSHRRFMFSGDYDHQIDVYRNNVTGETKGQVTMRVCEISELSDKEKPYVAEALTRWLTDYPGADRGGIIHLGNIEKFIKILMAPGHKISDRVYFAISSPEENGKDVIDVEGFIIVTEEDRPSLGNVSVMVSWEIKPDNRDVLLDRWWIFPKWLSRWLRIRTPKRKFRFIGIGRQLLAYSVWREIERGFDYFKFRLYAEKQLSKEGLYRNVLYNPLELKKFIYDRNHKTMNHLEKAAKAGDREAVKILRGIAKSSKEAVFPCI